MPFSYRDGIPQTAKAGVYCITNKVNGKVYVGSSMSLTGRMKGHRWCLRKGKHDNSYLQRSWDKYGEKAFKFSILETCPVAHSIAREQYWIDSLKACHSNYGYNLSPTAGSTRGFKHAPDALSRIGRNKGVYTEQMRKATELSRLATIGRKRPQEERDRISAGNKGKEFTEEHKQAIKATHWSKGPNAKAIAEKSAEKNRGKKHSEEHKMKISQGNYRRWERYRSAILHATTS